MRIAKQTENKIWFKGYGPDPYVYVVRKGAEPKFLGGTFIVERYSDLEKLGWPHLIILEAPN